jgi:hypothetical protein
MHKQAAIEGALAGYVASTGPGQAYIYRKIDEAVDKKMLPDEAAGQSKWMKYPQVQAQVKKVLDKWVATPGNKQRAIVNLGPKYIGKKVKEFPGKAMDWITEHPMETAAITVASAFPIMLAYLHLRDKAGFNGPPGSDS